MREYVGPISCSDTDLLFESLPEAICILDSGLCVVRVNARFLSLFQAELSTVLNKPINTAFTWPGNLERIPGTASQVYFGKLSSAQVEYCENRSQSDQIWFRFTISPIIEKLGTGEPIITGVVISAYDTTESHNLQTLQSQTAALLSIIHEITTSPVFSADDHPGHLEKHIVTRLGPILQSDFVSFFQITEEMGESLRIDEVAIWSHQSGSIMSDEPEGVTFTSTQEFHDFQNSYLIDRYIVLDSERAPVFFSDLMTRRNIQVLLLVPVFSQPQSDLCRGFLVLWDSTRRWNTQEIISLLSVTNSISSRVNQVRLESELSRSVEKFKGVIEYIGDMYYLTDNSGALLEISPSMAAALGYESPDILIGTSMQDLLKDTDVWPLFLSEVLTGNGVKDYELVFEGNQGKIITGSLSCRLIYRDDGSLSGIEGVIRDISRRRQYEQLVQESEWKLEQAQKIAKLGVWSYELTTRLFRVSSEVFSILVVPPETSRISLDDLIRITNQYDKPKISDYFESMVRAGNEFAFELKLDFSEGKFKYARIKGQPRIKDGIVTGSFGIIQDITERKEIEQHLLRYANQLEQKTLEMDVMRTQLLDMNRELDQRVRIRTRQIEELLRQKDEFIMQIGHDLKTPLTPLVAILPYIRKKVEDPELCELLDVSITDVATIRKMISTVLDLAQMNALYTVSDLREVNLRSSIEQIITDNAYLIHQKSLKVINDIPESFSVQFSPMHLETLFGNIISNAVKYSYIDGEIRLSANEISESVIIQVMDQGVGIDPEDIPRIFEEFFRADTSRHDRESHGLGLSIAMRVVEIYGGNITVKSEGIGKGSTFSIRLKKNPVFRTQSENVA